MTIIIKERGRKTFAGISDQANTVAEAVDALREMGFENFLVNNQRDDFAAISFRDRGQMAHLTITVAEDTTAEVKTARIVSNGPATPKQIALIRKLGMDAPRGLTKVDASAMIDDALAR